MVIRGDGIIVITSPLITFMMVVFIVTFDIRISRIITYKRTFFSNGVSFYYISPLIIFDKFSHMTYNKTDSIWGCTGFDRRFWGLNSESGFHLPRKTVDKLKRKT